MSNSTSTYSLSSDWFSRFSLEPVLIPYFLGSKKENTGINWGSLFLSFLLGSGNRVLKGLGSSQIEIKGSGGG
nr:MAG TPA: hypothetical protein [Caudoviricetes sp.]